jgi:hypothetical protein
MLAWKRRLIMNSKFHLTGFGKRAGAAWAAALALIAAAPAVSHAVGFGYRQWTTIGSAGVAMGGGVTNAGTAAVLDSNSATIRYNVVATDGLFATNPDFPFLATSTSMAARFSRSGKQQPSRRSFKKNRLGNVGDIDTIDNRQQQLWRFQPLSKSDCRLRPRL